MAQSPFQRSDAYYGAGDHALMEQALTLAARGRGRTAPNPMVGCVVVREGQVVGTGFHPRAGEPHAEVFAIDEAGDRARGATVFVTLEPCNHQGRTPPCTEALIRVGVARVVAAMSDPDPRVAGAGLQRLHQAGIQVQVGLKEAEARTLNRAYVKHRLTGQPLVTAKAAMTLDGKIACQGGDSKWITGPRARDHVHVLRDEVDAILVGVGTVLSDDPELTTRLPDRVTRDPIRVILDSSGRTPTRAKVLDPALRKRPGAAHTVIATTEMAGPDRVARLTEAGAEVIVVPGDRDGLVSLPHLLDELGRRGVLHLLVEGGASVHWSFFHHGLVNRVMFFIAPKLVGGVKAPGPLGGPGKARIGDAINVREIQVTRLGDDTLIEGEI